MLVIDTAELKLLPLPMPVMLAIQSRDQAHMQARLSQFDLLTILVTTNCNSSIRARVPFPDADISSHVGRIRGLQHVCSKPPNLTWRHSALQPPTVSSVFWHCCITAKRVPHQPPCNNSHSISRAPAFPTASSRVSRLPICFCLQSARRYSPRPRRHVTYTAVG